MHNARLFSLVFIFAAVCIVKVYADGINDDDIDNHGLKLLEQGYSSEEIIGAKAEYINEHTADVTQRISQVHIGTSYNELINIWSGWKAKTEVKDTTDGTVLIADYMIPTLTDTLKEMPVHIIYTVANNKVLKINFLNERTKDL